MKYVAYFIINILFLVVSLVAYAEEGQNNKDEKLSDMISVEKKAINDNALLNDQNDAIDEQKIENIKINDENEQEKQLNETMDSEELEPDEITLQTINDDIEQLKKTIEIENKKHAIKDKDQNLKILDTISKLIKNEINIDSDKLTDLNIKNEVTDVLISEEDVDEESEQEQNEIVDEDND